MRRLFLALPGLLLICFFCAQGFSAEVDENASNTLETKVFEGKVALAYTETPIQSYPGRIEVVDDSGQRLVFIVAENTKITKNGVKTSLRNANKGDDVVVEYISDNKNHKIAQTVKLSKGD